VSTTDNDPKAVSLGFKFGVFMPPPYNRPNYRECFVWGTGRGEIGDAVDEAVGSALAQCKAKWGG